MIEDFSREFIDKLIIEYGSQSKVAKLALWPTMYDDRSAEVNYAMVRYFKPKVVVEYGAYRGRCTHDILQALIDNGQDYTFKSYEADKGIRSDAQTRLDDVFGDGTIRIGGDVMLAKDLPQEIDYLFLDHSHNEKLSKWTWKTLIPRVKKGGLIQIHDIPLRGNFELGKLDGVFPETKQIIEMHAKGVLPFEKLYWLFEEDNTREGSWWIKT